ncbi:sensor domain-containing diguanylate cyclase [Mycobacterium sp. EPG1]|nr:sensor domain-containing diguanylate cyclase [Mycobacterium sp. EPG1]
MRVRKSHGVDAVSGKLSNRGSSPGHDETARLRVLGSLEILDTEPEESFDGLTELAAAVCDAPMALIGFVDADRVWIKSGHGVGLSDVAREMSFCGIAVEDGALVEIADTHADARFAGHPMVTGAPHLRFGAAMPIVTADGHRIGAVCVLDRRPRTLTDAQRRYLRTLARQVLALLELRSRANEPDSELARQQQRMLSGVLDHPDVLVFAKDVDGRFVMANRALQDVTNAGRSLIGGTDFDFFEKDIAEHYRRNDRQIMTTRERQVFSEEVVHPDGSVHIYRSTKFPLTDEAGEVSGVGGVSTDVTELAAARAAHAAAEERWRALVEQSQDPVVVVDTEGRIAYVNPAGVALLGVASAEDVALVSAMDFVPERIRSVTQALLDETLSTTGIVRSQRGVLRRHDGTELLVEFNATVVKHSGERSVQLEVRDVSEAVAAHAALKHSASTDPLTGVLNRSAWDAQVTPLLASVSEASPLTVAVIDLDNFKGYNDTRGHTAGDLLLQQFAGAAGASIRQQDIFARWGGEEFILALPGTDPQRAQTMLNRIRACVPFGQTCSIGYTGHRPGDTLTETVVRADKALYEAKSRGRDQLARR